MGWMSAHSTVTNCVAGTARRLETASASAENEWRFSCIEFSARPEAVLDHTLVGQSDRVVSGFLDALNRSADQDHRPWNGGLGKFRTALDIEEIEEEKQFDMLETGTGPPLKLPSGARAKDVASAVITGCALARAALVGVSVGAISP